MRDSCMPFSRSARAGAMRRKVPPETGLFDIMKAHFADQYQKQGLALSLELVEFSESGTLKHNNLHARLRKT